MDERIEISEMFDQVNCDSAIACFSHEVSIYAKQHSIRPYPFCECDKIKRTNCSFSISFSTKTGCFCPFHNYVRNNMKGKLFFYRDEIIDFLRSSASL